MNTNPRTNQIIFTDWTTNIQRIAEILKQVDQKVPANIAKLAEQNKKPVTSGKEKSTAPAKIIGDN